MQHRHVSAGRGLPPTVSCTKGACSRPMPWAMSSELHHRLQVYAAACNSLRWTLPLLHARRPSLGARPWPPGMSVEVWQPAPCWLSLLRSHDGPGIKAECADAARKATWPGDPAPATWPASKACSPKRAVCRCSPHGTAGHQCAFVRGDPAWRPATACLASLKGRQPAARYAAALLTRTGLAPRMQAVQQPLALHISV